MHIIIEGDPYLFGSILPFWHLKERLVVPTKGLGNTLEVTYVYGLDITHLHL